MPLLYAFLLYRCRQSIQDHRPSPLSRAIRFLWSDYEDGYCWYEMIALTKKLVRESSASSSIARSYSRSCGSSCAAMVPHP
eukprot:scaffold117751_cov67-Phaeocystis_antarctica.AAC.1